MTTRLLDNRQNPHRSGMDQAQAGGWLARKWHLPRDIVCVMEHHKLTDYRGEFWPIVLLVGYAERQASRLIPLER
jgi:HD-like signal output (HDOD) protein